MRFGSDAAPGHRTRVSGRVTLSWPGRLLCFKDASQGMCVEVSQSTPLNVGQEVDAVGFPVVGELAPTLQAVIFHPIHGAGEVPDSPRITGEQALSGKYDRNWLRLKAAIGRDRASKDPTLILSAGKFVFPLILPGS